MKAAPMEAAPIEAAHCIRANTHWQQSSCMCDISCGVCLSLSLWVGVNVHIICVCLYICITSLTNHCRFSSIGILSSNFIQLLWSACK